MSKRKQFKRKLKRLIGEEMKSTISKTRKSSNTVSSRTINGRVDQIDAMVDAIYDAQYYPVKPKNLAIKHMEAVLERWRTRGLSFKTLETYVSLLKPLFIQMERMDLEQHLRKGVQAMKEAALIEKGNHPATEDGEKPASRSWKASGVDLKQAIDEVSEIDSLVALQLTLQRQFGLRVRESFRFRPAESWRGKGDVLNIVRGTKGNRPRQVPIRSETDRELLEHALAVAKAQGGSMMPAEYEEKSWRSHYYGVLKACGITRADKGITSHGLRHEYAQELYQERSGLVAPALTDGSSPAHGVEGQADLEGRQAVSEALGHGRYDITRHYLDRMEAYGNLRNCTMRAPRGHGRIRKLAKQMEKVRKEMKLKKPRRRRRG